MNNIEWKDGAVCFAGDYQRCFIDGEWLRFMAGKWVSYSIGCTRKPPIEFKNFQLNEIREGDFIPASELDTEQKYNDVVEVFGLFGFEFKQDDKYSLIREGEMLAACGSGALLYYIGSNDIADNCKRQLTYNQLMAIGKLKRMMLECKDVKTQLEKRGIYAGKENTIKYNPDSMIIKDCGLVIAKPKRRNKSKQAYDILKSLDYEYDLVKQKWFRKEWF